MIIAVVGLWHLGCVASAGLAESGHTVIGLDDDPELMQNLAQGHPPIAEPGLAELLRKNMNAGRLTFTSDPQTIQAADVCWIAYDTPVDDHDIADVESVVQRTRRLFPHLKDRVLIIVSSQVPVGTTRRLEKLYQQACPNGHAAFVYSPENLRLGNAIEVFTNPDRVVVGFRNPVARDQIIELFKLFKSRINIEWMSIESAEMTKHALNAFLACSVSFINEIAALCELAGADAREVERGLKTDIRIGPKAYLKPGPAFAGGTLARDIMFLTRLGRESDCQTPLLSGIKESNDLHKEWLRRVLTTVLGTLAGKTLTVLGLTYKPGTDTLRRSSAIEVCKWLHTQGVTVRAFDPAVSRLPDELSSLIHLCSTAKEALRGADAALIATEWPEFKILSTADFLATMNTPRVFDPSRFLESELAQECKISYFAIGRGG